MDRCTFPFPLAVNSSHHSAYHRFQLGADPVVLAPLPKPACVGRMAEAFGGLAAELNLTRWRRLYHGAFPWVEGYGPEHYEPGTVGPHRPLPAGYGRPERRFGAFDFVQIADPSLCALALVAGDRRLVERFAELSRDFCRRLERGTRASAGAPEPDTGRFLAGLFYEPNDRWLMPLLHVHARVLNFTSTQAAPRDLHCVDPACLARAGREARQGWVLRQAQLLEDLGYRVGVMGTPAPHLMVQGVSNRLLAALQAPRIAVVELLGRLLEGDRTGVAGSLEEALPTAVISAMADTLGSLVAKSVAYHRPPKLGIPSEGPWRAAVREHLRLVCPAALAALDAEASRVRAVPIGTPVFPSPPLDPAHLHAPDLGALRNLPQHPAQPELGGCAYGAAAIEPPSAWLARRFGELLDVVNARVVRGCLDAPREPGRSLVLRMDQLTEGADPGQLLNAHRLLEGEMERRLPERRPEPVSGSASGRRPSLASLDALFEQALQVREHPAREIGGRCL